MDYIKWGDMQELIQRVGRAKAFIDNGMCRVGPGMDESSVGDALLVRGAGRAIVLADAIVALCRQDHPEEALAVLRQLAETAVSLRWLAAMPEQRAPSLESDLRSVRWENLWEEERFLTRAREAGLEAEAKETLSYCIHFVRGGRVTLPWGHRFGPKQDAELHVEEVLRRAGAWLNLVLKALDARWPGFFPGAEQP